MGSIERGRKEGWDLAEQEIGEHPRAHHRYQVPPLPSSQIRRQIRRVPKRFMARHHLLDVRFPALLVRTRLMTRHAQYPTALVRVRTMGHNDRRMTLGQACLSLDRHTLQTRIAHPGTRRACARGLRIRTLANIGTAFGMGDHRFRLTTGLMRNWMRIGSGSWTIGGACAVFEAIGA